MPLQQEIFDTLRVHCQQGGLCVVVGEPGTGKSVVKQALCRHDPKRMLTPVVNRTLHTYHSTLRILCQAFQIDTEGYSDRCEHRLIEEAQRVNHLGKMLKPGIFTKLSLSVNDDIKSRVTYSALVPKLGPDGAIAFILGELDRVALAHNTFTEDALALIVRSSEGVLRAARNLCVASLLEAVRDRTRCVDLKQVNRVLLQPHWRHQREQDE